MFSRREVGSRGGERGKKINARLSFLFAFWGGRFRTSALLFLHHQSGKKRGFLFQIFLFLTFSFFVFFLNFIFYGKRSGGEMKGRGFGFVRIREILHVYTGVGL